MKIVTRLCNTVSSYETPNGMRQQFIELIFHGGVVLMQT